MNSRRLTLFSGCVAGAALLWTWYLLSRQPDPVPARLTDLPDRKSSWPDKANTAAWPARGTPELRERLREPAARWLDSRGRDAAGLIAIWDLCRDPDILNEAASRFPNEPIVCRAMVESCADQPERALFWIEKLIAAEPKNPDGYYLTAWARFAKDDTSGALEALRSATATHGDRNTHHRQRAELLTKAATATGLPARTAALAPIEFVREQRLARQLYDLASPALITSIEQARDAGDTDAIGSLGHIALAACFSLRDSSSMPVSLDDELSANRFCRTILDRVPDELFDRHAQEFYPVTRGVSAAEWREHVMRRSKDLANYSSWAIRAAECLASAPDESVVEYSNDFIIQGEAVANALLLAQREPAPK